jgi:hypothetical protein
VATHKLLDRLIHGRIWIGVIAFALIGIVTMQLGLLQLNAGIGRSLEREALLQRDNTTLSAENSEMAAGERIEAQAERMGMEIIPSGALRFLAANPSLDARRGAAALSAPVPTAVPGTTASAESPSGAEAGVAEQFSAGAELATAGGDTSAAVSPVAAEAPTSASAGTVTETGSAAGAPASEASTGAGAGSTGEAGGGGAQPTAATSPVSDVSGGAGVPVSPSVSASTGGGVTPGG